MRQEKNAFEYTQIEQRDSGKQKYILKWKNKQ